MKTTCCNVTVSLNSKYRLSIIDFMKTTCCHVTVSRNSKFRLSAIGVMQTTRCHVAVSSKWQFLVLLIIGFTKITHCQAAVGSIIQ